MENHTSNSIDADSHDLRDILDFHEVRLLSLKLD
jgi:hypothetical protein